MAEAGNETRTDLIEQALDNLVNQFANPMDFLRELVQNSIDAGSPRIEVEVRYKAGSGHHGVVEIDVRDFGQGMDEDVIDAQLTRLFSSAKEGDRTAIGKFGIGFTSVFAIRPDVVRVLTGKHGEHWEVLFHRDRTFEKRRLDALVSGTTITVYKRMRAGKVAELVADARASLVHWCEHARTPILFIDSTLAGDVASTASASHDPFAGFDAEPVGEPINRPFELPDAVLQIDHEARGVRVVIGYTDAPRWAFFSGGLTLLRSEDPGHLGVYEKDFRSLSFKILSGTVGHTLTRDNVIQDENWHAAMKVAREAAVLLRSRAIERMEALARAGDREELGVWQQRLAADLAREPLDRRAKVFLDPLLRSCDLEFFASRLGLLDDELWAADPADRRLGEALLRAEVAAFADEPRAAALLRGCFPNQRIHRASDTFCVAERLPRSELSEAEAALIGGANDLAGRATGGTFVVLAGDLGEHSPLLFVEGRSAKGLYRVPEREGLRGLARRQLKRWQTWLGRRYLLVNRSHPHVRALLEHPDLELAAYALVEALVVQDAGFPEATLFHLHRIAERRWV